MAGYMGRIVHPEPPYCYWGWLIGHDGSAKLVDSVGMSARAYDLWRSG